MSYRPSEPLRRWRGSRQEAVEVIAAAHLAVSRRATATASSAGRRPLTHAFITTMVGQFQGFVRDLHDLCVERIVTTSGAQPPYAAILIDGLVSGRAIDRGNATHLKTDFARLGLSPFQMSAYNDRWTGAGEDAKLFDRLIALRNLLAHANEKELRTFVTDADVRET